ncbi:MAG TPA: class I SAM-dependent methyltransferase, partial [Proteobacteria bacterium]|nr:class I SAM-dependent methyltransferase [Pseudomonadota bacterium]
MEFTGERLIPDEEKLLDLYYEHFARYLYAAEFVEDKVVLDLGCGCGYGTYELAEAGARLAVGIDNSDEAIRYARSRYRHRRSFFAVADALELPFGDDSFDVIVCMEVLEHLEDQKALLSEIARVLKGDGILLISTPNPNRPTISGEREPNPFHVREVELEEFRDLLASMFKNVKILFQARRSGIWLWHPQQEAEASQSLDAPQPEYFLAICSNDDLPEILGCMYHFSHFKNIESLLEHLKRQDEQLADRGEKIVELQKDVEEKVDWAKRLELAVVALRKLSAHHEARAILFKREYERVKSSIGYRLQKRIEPMLKAVWRALKALPRLVLLIIKAAVALPFALVGFVLLILIAMLTALYALPVLFAWIAIGLIAPKPRPKPKPLLDSARTDGVSIVIPSWNGKDLLALSLPALKKALEKTEIKHEIIVV